MKNKHAPILLVESDQQEITYLLDIFKAKGINNPVYLASDGLTALNMIQGNGMPALSPAPKIILLDLHLPGNGGMEFLLEIRKDPKFRACSVYVMTQQATEQNIQDAYNLNVAGFILKPLQDHSFHEVIDTLHAYWKLIELPN